MKYKAVIFDMDGTILDTIEDMKDSFNHILALNGHKSDYVADEVCFFFGCGIQIAFTRALAVEKGISLEDVLNILEVPKEKESLILSLSKQWSAYYAEHCTTHTKPYDGIVESINEMKGKGFRVAVVSNKPDPAVRILADQYFPGVFDGVIGERKDILRKPAPDMLLQTVKNMNLSISDCLYVGDSEVDVKTARNAGCDVMSVTWGFRKKSFLEIQQPDYIVEKADEMIDLL